MSEDSGAAPGLRIHQAVAHKLGTAILSGRIAPGARIGNEVEAAHELGVSRTAYREALRILVAKGLLASKPKTGTVVTPEDRWNLLDPDVLEWMFAETPDRAFVRDLFALRGIIEPVAAGLAARFRSSEQIETMRGAIATMREQGLANGRGQAADRAFHRTLLAASGNRALRSLGSSIMAAVQWTTHFKQRRSEQPRDPIPDHEQVLNAIAQGNEVAARKAMQRLLELALVDMGPTLS